MYMADLVSLGNRFRDVASRLRGDEIPWFDAVLVIRFS
jgi:hypothetical protein